MVERESQVGHWFKYSTALKYHEDEASPDGISVNRIQIMHQAWVKMATKGFAGH